MSSKSKRSTKSRESVIHVNTNIDESSSGANGSGRSQSPGGLSISTRQDEKKQLSLLNDRLATYIETVRKLEGENKQLFQRIEHYETVEKSQKDNLENRYEGKITDLRKIIDALTRDKARLQIECDKYLNEREDYKDRAANLEKELKISDADRKKQNAKVQDLTASFNNADNARVMAEKEAEGLKKEVDIMSNQNDLLHRQLEDEVVLRTEVENRLTSLKEDLEFARRTHQTQIDEVRRKRQVEMTTFSTEVEDRYQNLLQEQLQNMRADSDNRIAQNRAEVDAMYRKKLDDAAANSNQNRESAARSREEAASMRSQIREFEKRVKDNDETIHNLRARISDLEARVHRAHDEKELGFTQRDEKITQLEREIDAMIKDYQDLLDVKVQLDTELQAYHKLLETEETRLRITPASSPNTSLNVSTSSGQHVSFADSVGGLLVTDITLTSSPRRGFKRRHVDEETESSFTKSAKSYKTTSKAIGDIVIEDADNEGKYVCIQNKGTEDIMIGSYYINYIAGTLEVKYKFASRQVLKAGKSTTVWSNNAGQSHSSPMNLVMKNQNWPTGNVARVELYNAEGEVIAGRESILETSGYMAGTDPNERCSIM